MVHPHPKDEQVGRACRAGGSRGWVGKAGRRASGGRPGQAVIERRAGRAVGSGRLVGTPDRAGLPGRRIGQAGRVSLPMPAGAGGES